jgi:parvulin-like peptidyl-prolyl isomerase
VTDKAVTQQLNQIRQSSQFGGSEQKFQKFLADRKLTVADARRILRYQLEQPKLIAYVTRGVRFTAADAKRYYDANPAQFKVPAQRQARHILVKSKALADKISAEVNDGNFAALAKRYSIDPGSKSQGGELGPIQKGQVVPEFEKVVFGLKDGQISKPFKTQFGWHIVEAQVTPARSQTFAQARSQIISSQLSAKRNAEFTKWRDKILADYEKRTTYADEKLKPPETVAQTTPAQTTPAPAATTP